MALSHKKRYMKRLRELEAITAYLVDHPHDEIEFCNFKMLKDGLEDVS